MDHTKTTDKGRAAGKPVVESAWAYVGQGEIETRYGRRSDLLATIAAEVDPVQNKLLKPLVVFLDAQSLGCHSVHMYC